MPPRDSSGYPEAVLFKSSLRQRGWVLGVNQRPIPLGRSQEEKTPKPFCRGQGSLDLWRGVCGVGRGVRPEGIPQDLTRFTPVLETPLPRDRSFLEPVLNAWVYVNTRVGPPARHYVFSPSAN